MVSETGIASQIPGVPKARGIIINAAIRKTKPRSRAKIVAGVFCFF